MPKSSALASALAAPRTADPAAAIQPAVEKPRAYPVPPSRVGRCAVTFYVPKPARLVLRNQALARGVPLQQLLLEYVAAGLRADGAPAID